MILKNPAASKADFYVRFFTKPVGRSRHRLFSIAKPERVFRGTAVMAESGGADDWLCFEFRVVGCDRPGDSSELVGQGAHHHIRVASLA